MSDGFSGAQRTVIDRAIRAAETRSRFEFSVYVGELAQPSRDTARALHARLAAPTRSVLVAVDPRQRELQIVTGADVRRTLDDKSVGLVATSMHADFAAGDLVGGLSRAVTMLAEYADAPEVMYR
ncbi:DUF5130 family protein [Marmoricola endophyticus]|nr:DUF5130 family protein [Marmoricola endophyticus]